MVTIRPTKAFCLKVLQLEHTGTRDRQGCHKRQIFHPSWGSRYFAAVASEVMTNTLGFLEFYKSARWKEAGLAACDLDTPYILVTQGRQILADADCPDFAALQLRQAVWRSVPLAIVGFFLACRPFLEVPACQVVQSISMIANCFGVMEDNNLWIQKVLQDFKKEELDFIEGETQRFGYKMGLHGNDAFIEHFREVQGVVWNSCRCQDSEFKVQNRTFSEGTLFPFALGPVEELGDLGGGGWGLEKVKKETTQGSM